MPTSAVGSKASLANLKTHTREFHSSQMLACVQLRSKTSWRASLGFTLMELLVVIALIAIGTAAVSFTLRDTSQTLLERDAERLAAVLESARARSRSNGVPLLNQIQTVRQPPLRLTVCRRKLCLLHGYHLKPKWLPTACSG